MTVPRGEIIFYIRIILSVALTLMVKGVLH